MLWMPTCWLCNTTHSAKPLHSEICLASLEANSRFAECNGPALLLYHRTNMLVFREYKWNLRIAATIAQLMRSICELTKHTAIAMEL